MEFRSKDNGVLSHEVTEDAIDLKCQLPVFALPLEKSIVNCTQKGAIPKPYRLLQNVQSISACIHRNAVIDKEYRLWVWGASEMARVEEYGSYVYTNDAPQNVNYHPQLVMDDVVAVSQGAWHTLARTKDNLLFGYGVNSSGELGIGDCEEHHKPAFIMNDCIRTFANDSQSFAIKTNHSLWGWGYNGNSLILGGAEICCKPIELLDEVVDVCVGNDVAFVVKSDSSLWAWGRNTTGIIFTSPQFHQCNVPQYLMSGVKKVSLSPAEDSNYALVLMENGDLYSLGYGEPGSLVTSKQRKSVGLCPVKIMNTVADISVGHHFSLIQLQDGRVFSVGRNDLGQCGNGKSTGSIKTPLFIMSHAISIAAGHYHGMGLQENGDLWIWGGDYSLTIRNNI